MGTLPGQRLRRDVGPITELRDGLVHSVPHIGRTYGALLTTRDTVFCETPARRATSTITTREEAVGAPLLHRHTGPSHDGATIMLRSQQDQ